MGEDTATYEDLPEARRHYRGNFILGILNGALFKGGLAFSHPSTVLPVFVSLFTGSSMLIGLTGTMMSVGWLLPQIAVARYAEHLGRKMILYKAAAVFRLLSWLGLIVSLFWVKDLGPILYLSIFFACLGLYSLMGGGSGIAFLEIVGKTIRPDNRGRYFGFRSFFGGLIASLAGVVVAFVLGNSEIFPFPSNYMVLFSLTFIFILIAIIIFSLVREPRGAVKKRREKTTSEYLSNVRELVSADPNYRNFLLTMVLCYSSSLSISFYVVYARGILAAPASWIGVYVTVETLSTLVANLVWGHLGDRYGYRNMIRLCSLLCALTPIMAIMAVNHVMFVLVFILKGASLTGIYMAKNNYTLEIAPVTRRSTYLGALNTLLAFVMMLPVVGGLIIDISGYDALFLLTAAIMVLSFFQANRLREPRDSVTNG